jgi:hypothetical protein
MGESRQHGGTIGDMDEGSRDEREARSSPRAVAAALILALVILAAAGVFLAVLFSRACA